MNEKSSRTAWRIAIPIVLVAAVVSVLYVRSREQRISTNDALVSLRSAGFHRLVVHRNWGITEPTYDDIDPRGQWSEFAPIKALRFHSSARAKAALWTRAELNKELAAKRRYRPNPYVAVGWLDFPRGFDARKWHSARVCNVVVSSYNAKQDPSLTTRFKRAVSALRKKCPHGWLRVLG